MVLLRLRSVWNIGTHAWLTRKAPSGAWFGASPNLSLLDPFGAPNDSDVKVAYGRSARFHIALIRGIGKHASIR